MGESERAQLIDVFSEQARNYETAARFFTPLAADLIRLAELRPGQDVLDVGCGRGAVLFQAAEIVGPNGSVAGIDIAPGMVEAAAADVAARSLAGVTVALMDGHSPEFPAESFDRVLGSMSIIMIPDLLGALRNYHRLLRRGGTLGFTAPALGTDPLEWRIGPFYLRRFLAEALPDRHPSELSAMLDVFEQVEPHRMLTDLRTAGFREPRAIDVTTTVRGDSGEDLVSWTFTHGTRAFWNLVPEPGRSRYAREWAQRIDKEFDGRRPVFETVNRVFLAEK
jgi:O-methyltransferase/aklanonic acid methyltransferase